MRAAGTASQLTDRAVKGLERAREGADVALDRAGEAAEVARERAAEIAEVIEPAQEEVAARLERYARSAVSALSSLSGLMSRLLELLSRVLGSVAERGREAAAKVEPPRAQRRRSKLRTAAWFAGGFAAGAATGWLVRDRLQSENDPYAYDYDARRDRGSDAGYGDPYGDEAAAIDARRENAPLG